MPVATHTLHKNVRHVGPPDRRPLCFQKKKFEISALTQKFTFYTNNDEKSKHLFHLCKQIHLFTQSVKERLAALRQRTEDGELPSPPLA